MGLAILLAAIGTLVWAGFAQSSTIYHYKSEATQDSYLKLVPADHPKASLIKGAISFYSDKYGYDADTLTALAGCESGFRDICIVDSNNKLSCGIFMFQKTTLEHYCPDLQWNYSVNDDVICAGRVIKNSLADFKHNWVTCSGKILK